VNFGIISAGFTNLGLALLPSPSFAKGPNSVEIPSRPGMCVRIDPRRHRVHRQVAEFLGLSESAGSIAVGKRADLLLLDDNPLFDIRNTQHIRAVVLEGRLLQRPDLDRLLETVGDSEAK
jgi:amidohydrolase family protein